MWATCLAQGMLVSGHVNRLALGHRHLHRRESGSPLRFPEDPGASPNVALMIVNGIVPNVPVATSEIDRGFYTDFLTLNPRFEHGDVAGFSSGTKPAAQVHLMAGASGQEPDYPVISVQVTGVEAAYDEARRRGYEITYPLTQEEFGPHHFYVRTPGGTLVNIIEHDN